MAWKWLFGNEHIYLWITKSFSRNKEFNCWRYYRLIKRQVILQSLHYKVKFVTATQRCFVMSLPCFFKMFPSIFLILINRDCLADCKRGQWRRKCVVVSISRPQPHIALIQSWKLCLNLLWHKSLKPKRNLVSNFKS